MLEDLFEQTKQELISLVIEFEKTERKIHFLNNVYYLQFYTELEQQRYLQCENDYLVKAIALKSEGKTIEEVKNFLEQCRKEFSTQIQSFYRQHQTALEMERLSKSYKKEDLDKVDEEFEWYCANYHPLVKAHSTEAERNVYVSLVALYRVGNVMGAKNFLKESRSLFTSTEVLENEKEKLIQLYQESISHLKEMISKAKDSFPLNKENIFYDENLLTREEIYLREKNYTSRDMNKALQEDFKQHFSFEFTL